VFEPDRFYQVGLFIESKAWSLPIEWVGACPYSENTGKSPQKLVI
jgi:hypothetical protein